MKDLLTPEDILKARDNEQDHLWVKITCTIVEIQESSQHYAVYSTEEETERAEEDAVFGCYFCDVPLTEGYGTPCTQSTST